MALNSGSGALDFLIARPIAHRGLHDWQRGVVENTASAFAAAIDRDYAIECDLQLTKDGEAVVFHDHDLERLTLGHGHVKDKTLADMKAQTLRHTSDRVQSLAELLQQVAGRVPLVIELKSDWDGDERLALRTLDVLKDYKGQYCLMSFDPDIIETVKRESPSTMRGMVNEGGDYEWLPPVRKHEMRSFKYMKRTDPHFMSFHFGDFPFAGVTAFRNSGRPVISWTIRTPEQERIARRFSDQITFEGYLA
jgi:glycerophosphoryl diester phosphodiesterase